MKLTEVDKAILTSVSERALFAHEVEHKVYFMTEKRVSPSSLATRMVKLINVGLITQEGMLGGVYKFFISDLGEKLLRAGEESKQKKQREEGRCNLS